MALGLCCLLLNLAYTNCSGFGGLGTIASSSNSSSSVGTVPGRVPLYGDYAKIPSNFDIQPFLWGTAGENVQSYNIGDAVGAFRFLCNASHVAYDDPIVFPGRPGASHLHTFFGNTKTDGHSTYESLRTTGEGTCHGGPINRSAYWMPSTMNGKGKVVMPDYLVIYYKGEPKHVVTMKDGAPIPNPAPNAANDPRIQFTYQTREGIQLTGTEPYPRGLRMLFGYDFARPAAPGQSGFHWNCDGPGAVSGHYKNIREVIDAGCPLGTRIGVVLAAPGCWDGKHLDSADHRSHLAYEWRAADGSTGDAKCPITHPIKLPHFQLGAWFTHEGPEDLENWYLSSDRMPGMPAYEPGSTFHSDWFGAWDDDVMETWVKHAINDFRNTSEGGLGEGRGMARSKFFQWEANPRLVDIPTLTPTQKAIQKKSMQEWHKLVMPEMDHSSH